MRLKKIDVNPLNNKIELDLKELPSIFIVVVSEGKTKITELPAHGETKIVTHQGKVKRVKWDEGEEF